MTTPSGTEWGQYGLADIWDMVRDDNYDNFSHVKAWKKMAELCHGMAGSLTAAAAELGHRWPPEQSPAAAAFKERLDELANKFTQAGQAAGANGPTLAEVNRGFAISRGKIVELCRSWQQMERAEFDRVAAARQVLKLVSLPMSDRDVLSLSNSVPLRYAVDAMGAPVVPTSWRQQFDGQARDIMATTDGEIIDAHSRIQKLAGDSAQSGDVADWPERDQGVPVGGGLIGGRSTPPPTRPIPPGLPERSPTPEDPILDGGSHPGPVRVPGGRSRTAAACRLHRRWPSPMGDDSNRPALAPGGVIGERSTGAPGSARRRSWWRHADGAAPVRPGGGAADGGFVAPPGGLIGGAPIGRGGHADAWRGCGRGGTAAERG